MAEFDILTERKMKRLLKPNLNERLLLIKLMNDNALSVVLTMRVKRFNIYLPILSLAR